MVCDLSLAVPPGSPLEVLLRETGLNQSCDLSRLWRACNVTHTSCQLTFLELETLMTDRAQPDHCVPRCVTTLLSVGSSAQLGEGPGKARGGQLEESVAVAALPMRRWCLTSYRGQEAMTAEVRGYLMPRWVARQAEKWDPPKQGCIAKPL